MDDHHHLWDMSDPDHRYKHLRHETSGDHVAVSFDRDADPWGDLQWLQKPTATNENQLPNGLVAHPDLTDDDEPICECTRSSTDAPLVRWQSKDRHYV